MNPYLNDQGELTGFDVDWVLDLIGVPHWTSSGGRILYSGNDIDEEQRIEYVAYLIGIYYRAFRTGRAPISLSVTVDKKLVRELIPTLQAALSLAAMGTGYSNSRR